MTYSYMEALTLPSAMHRFTSEFGMGSGGSNALLSPGKLVGVAWSYVRLHSLASPNK